MSSCSSFQEKKQCANPYIVTRVAETEVAVKCVVIAEKSVTFVCS